MWHDDHTQHFCCRHSCTDCRYREVMTLKLRAVESACTATALNQTAGAGLDT